MKIYIQHHSELGKSPPLPEEEIRVLANEFLPFLVKMKKGAPPKEFDFNRDHDILVRVSWKGLSFNLCGYSDSTPWNKLFLRKEGDERFCDDIYNYWSDIAIFYNVEEKRWEVQISNECFAPSVYGKTLDEAWRAVFPAIISFWEGQQKAAVKFFQQKVTEIKKLGTAFGVKKSGKVKTKAGDRVL